MCQADAYRMTKIGNHTPQATGIHRVPEGRREPGDRPADRGAHQDSRTTGLYDRRGDEISLDGIERFKTLGHGTADPMSEFIGLGGAGPLLAEYIPRFHHSNHGSQLAIRAVGGRRARGCQPGPSRTIKSAAANGGFAPRRDGLARGSVQSRLAAAHRSLARQVEGIASAPEYSSRQSARAYRRGFRQFPVRGYRTEIR